VKINLPVTGNEVPFTRGTIVSKTDLKGIITYANDAFVEISGFSREELIGKNHNIVRHPDMPPAAFAWLWETIKAGRPWRGIVKNRAKNGDHYWVDAFVVPVRKKGEVVEYMSVRTPASRADIAAAESLYRQINAGKALPRPGLAKRLTIRTGLAALIGINGLLLVAAGLLGYFGMHAANGILIAVAVAVSVAIGIHLNTVITAGLSRIIGIFERIAEGDLTNKIEIDGADEPGQVLAALAYMQVHLKVILDEVALASSIIESRSARLKVEMDEVSARFQIQADRVMQASAAMEEMSIAIKEVAESAGATADAANRTQAVVETGTGQMEKSMEATSRVVEAVESSGATINDLNQAIGKIGAITNVIKEIADQTNLLALNAAIEAARAGEQGRGFAVVADEVRKLAERTTASTADITAMVESIRSATGAAVGSMESARREVEQGLELMKAGSHSLQEIQEASVHVNDMARHIAEASRQQSAAGEEIAGGMEQVSELAETSARTVRGVRLSTEELARVAAGLQALVQHFDAQKG
jgi:aerotaxis receptor